MSVCLIVDIFLVSFLYDRKLNIFGWITSSWSSINIFLHFIDHKTNWLVRKIINRVIDSENNHLLEWTSVRPSAGNVLLTNVPSEFSVCGVCPSDRLKVPLSVHVTSDTSVSDTDISLHTVESSCRRETQGDVRFQTADAATDNLICWLRLQLVEQFISAQFKFTVMI